MPDPLPVGVFERDRAGHPVRAVRGDLDRGWPLTVAVHVGAGLGRAQRIRQGPGRAIAGGPDDLVHPSAAGCHERIVS